MLRSLRRSPRPTTISMTATPASSWVALAAQASKATAPAHLPAAVVAALSYSHLTRSSAEQAERLSATVATELLLQTSAAKDLTDRAARAVAQADKSPYTLQPFPTHSSPRLAALVDSQLKTPRRTANRTPVLPALRVAAAASGSPASEPTTATLAPRQDLPRAHRLFAHRG